MQSFQTDPLLPFARERTPTLRKAWSIVTTHVRAGRLIREDEGVRGPLWFGSDPASPYHVLANVLRLLFAILLAPGWMWYTPRNQEWFKNRFLRPFFWPHELPQTPESILVGNSSPHDTTAWGTEKKGEYAASVLKPKWLMEVQFRGEEVAAQRQVRYEDVKRRVEDGGYTAISYPMKSAEQLFTESGLHLDPQPEYQSTPGGMKYNLRNRKKISQAILNEYARARTTSKGKTDGIEYVWLDELCLSDESVTNEVEAQGQRFLGLGQLADIFRAAKRVVVFCHIADCNHTGTECPWGSRLFTLTEILHASRVLQMTRTYDSDGDDASLFSVLTSMAGQEFRTDIMAKAAEAKMWDLYNIMQHSTHSGGVSWQSAIHSLILEILRRDEADGSTSHNLLGKVLNGLLAREADPADLQGTNGWADLAWLLELNQGYYNAAMLAAVCKIADPEVNGYRWWGKPITPKEGSERLEPLVTATPVKFHDELTNSTVPVLSLIGPQVIDLDYMLQRDSGALERQPEMEALRFWALIGWFVISLIGFILVAAIGGAGIIIYWVSSILYVGLQLMVGTIYVEKDQWVVVEDWKAPGHDAYRFLQSQDPTYTRKIEWDHSKQLIPKWEVPHTMEPRTNRGAANPYPVTLIDLHTGVMVKTLVTTRPNSMAPLAVHGSGVTCMLLDHDTYLQMSTISVKVGMANLPPRALSQTKQVGNVYVGGNSFKQGKLRIPFMTWLRATISGVDVDDVKKHGSTAVDAGMRLSKKGDNLEMQDVSLEDDFGSSLQKTVSFSSTTPIIKAKKYPHRTGTESSSGTVVAVDLAELNGKGDGSVESDISLTGMYPPSRYREMPKTQWFPERRGAENV